MTWCKLHPPEFYKDDILQREHSSQCIELIGEYVEKRRNIQHAGSLSTDSQAHNKVFFLHSWSVSDVSAAAWCWFFISLHLKPFLWRDSLSPSPVYFISFLSLWSLAPTNVRRIGFTCVGFCTRNPTPMFSSLTLSTDQCSASTERVLKMILQPFFMNLYISLCYVRKDIVGNRKDPVAVPGRLFSKCR